MRVRRTEKQIITTCVSAYERDLNRSKSSCPERHDIQLKSGQKGPPTGRIPKTELHRLIVNLYQADVVLEDYKLSAGPCVV